MLWLQPVWSLTANVKAQSVVHRRTPPETVFLAERPELSMRPPSSQDVPKSKKLHWPCSQNIRSRIAGIDCITLPIGVEDIYWE